TTTVNISTVDDAPVIDLNGPVAGTGHTATFVENGAAVEITAPTMSLADDTPTLASVTVTLTNAQVGDVMAIGSIPAGITASIVGNVITLTGTASPADYQVAVRAITYLNTSDNPNTTPRTISIVANDGIADSNAAIATINVTPVNDAPVLDLDISTAGTGYTAFVISNSDV